ncbi:hypothetical protein MIR68_004560 [Amoeboaphelidium protococcarum]|nr:hypothetical protein MIR68_004560 [Amoeboaphelidium protococcarum]
MLVVVCIAMILLAELCCGSSPIKDTLISRRDIITITAQIQPVLSDDLLQMDFFRYFRINLNGKCPFDLSQQLEMSNHDKCGNSDCSVSTELDAKTVKKLSDLEAKSSFINSPFRQKCDYTRMDFCELDASIEVDAAEDFDSSGIVVSGNQGNEQSSVDGKINSKNGGSKQQQQQLQYIDLVQNPERFTGYGGFGARSIWSAVYEQNCFKFLYGQQQQQQLQQQKKKTGSLPLNALPSKNSGLMNANSLLKPYSSQQSDHSLTYEMEQGLEELCVEKRMFYRVISGLHASISTHLCYEYYYHKVKHNTEDGGVEEVAQWKPNKACFMDRVGNHEDRVNNLYYLQAILLQALYKMKATLQNYQFCGSDIHEEVRTMAILDKIQSVVMNKGPFIDQSALFRKEGQFKDLKEEFRQHFINISLIMNCVGCERCRLWGKVQTTGIGTALKVLFSSDGNDESVQDYESAVLGLRREEIVAFFNTLARISESIVAVEQFMDQEKPSTNNKKQKSRKPVLSDPSTYYHYIQLLKDAIRLLRHYVVKYVPAMVSIDPLVFESGVVGFLAVILGICIQFIFLIVQKCISLNGNQKTSRPSHKIRSSQKQ